MIRVTLGAASLSSQQALAGDVVVDISLHWWAAIENDLGPVLIRLYRLILSPEA